MNTGGKQTVVECFRILLRPVLRFCLRKALSIQEITESIKIVFLQLAVEDIEARGEVVNVSRLSAVTGLHRRDVQRIYKEGRSKDCSFNLINKVIGQWQGDEKFRTKAGKPKVLTWEGPDSEFKTLMETIATDLKPGTVLFELERLEIIEYTKAGIKLIAKVYQPVNDPEENFRILADDANDIIQAVEENVFNYADAPHLHAKTVYDNIDSSDLETIQKWIVKEGGAFHARARKFLEKFDLDVNPDPEKTGGQRVAVGTFSRLSFTEDREAPEEAA